MFKVYSQNRNLLPIHCLLIVDYFLYFRDSGIIGIGIWFQTPSPFLLLFLWYEEETTFFCQGHLQKYLINLLPPHLVCVGSDVPQCVASVGGVLKAVKKGALHPESTPGGNGSWERAAGEYFLFCSE